MLPRPSAAAATTPAVELSIVVPSFNERDNVTGRFQTATKRVGIA